MGNPEFERKKKEEAEEFVRKSDQARSLYLVNISQVDACKIVEAFLVNLRVVCLVL